MQVVGSIKITCAPLLIRWWNAPLVVASSGLTTSLMSARTGCSFAIDFDLREHRLDVTTTTGQSHSMALEPNPVRDFRTELMILLEPLDLTTEIWPVPVKLHDAIVVPEDDPNDSYDSAAITAL